jgi:hypothetical protein
MFILNKILYGAVTIAVVLQIALQNRTLPGLNFHQAPIESKRLS